MSALEGEFLARANLVEDVSLLLFQPSDLLHELILVEIELEFRHDLVVEQSGVVVMRGSSLRCVVEEPLQELGHVVVGPQPLKQPPRVIQRRRRRLFLRESSCSTCILSNFTISAAPPQRRSRTPSFRSQASIALALLLPLLSRAMPSPFLLPRALSPSYVLFPQFLFFPSIPLSLFSPITTLF